MLTGRQVVKEHLEMKMRYRNHLYMELNLHLQHKITNLKYFTYTCLLSECIRPTVTQRLCNTETTDGEI